jgi:hypothetical protein
VYPTQRFVAFLWQEKEMAARTERVARQLSELCQSIIVLA